MGPIGSGKSVASVVEIIRKSSLQEPNSKGIRETRWAVIRNTYRELVDTTIKTFFDWVDKDLGVFRQMDMSFFMKVKLEDGTSMHCEVLFRALDKPDDIRKLLSLELTGAWINEAREVPKQVLDMLQGRVGRFPSKRDTGATWSGIIMDTNPPDTDHWWYNLFEVTRPKDFKLFKQPGGLDPSAENIANLPDRYYDKMMSGKDGEWVNVYIHGKYGFLSDGRPVYPEYNDSIHSSLDTVELEGSQTIYVGIDFGLTPAATFAVLLPDNQFAVFDELVTDNMGAVKFAQLLREKMHSYIKQGHTFEIYGDPAGEQRAQTDETTPFMVLWNSGIEAWPCYTNDFTIRREAVATRLLQLTITGRPSFCIYGGAPMARRAHAGGYKFKRVQVSGTERYMDKPDKGRYSHVAESLQYCILGALGDDSVIGGYGKQKIDYSQTDRMIV
jgi:Phage terminase large subunit